MDSSKLPGKASVSVTGLKTRAPPLVPGGRPFSVAPPRCNEQASPLHCSSSRSRSVAFRIMLPFGAALSVRTTGAAPSVAKRTTSVSPGATGTSSAYAPSGSVFAV